MRHGTRQLGVLVLYGAFWLLGGCAGTHLEEGKAFHYGMEREVDRAKALRHYHAACEEGAHQGCALAGDVLHEGGAGVKRDREAARVYFDRACKAGVPVACSRLAWYHWKGLGGMTRSWSQAISLYEKLCAGGRLESCVEAGRVHLERDRTRASARRAVALFRRACDQGAMDGCAEMGWLLHQDERVRQRPREGFELVRKACESPEITGCVQLGMIYASGRGVARDTVKARGLLRGRCAQGDGYACFGLAGLPNVDRIALIRRGCKLGDSRACGVQGLIDLKNAPQERIVREAEKVLAHCAKHTKGPGFQVQRCLGESYRFLRQPHTAIQHDRAACRLGGVDGCVNVWRYYERFPERGRANHADHLTQLERGCALGSPELCEALWRARVFGKWGKDAAPKAALAFFQTRCDEQNTSQMCHHTGHTLWHLANRTADPKRGVYARQAELYLRKACAGTHAPSCVSLAHLYDSLSVYFQPQRLRAEMLERACQLQDPEGCNFHADALLYGRGRPQNPNRGQDILKQQCGQGVPNSCVELGDYWRWKGRHVNAFDAFTRACEQRKEREGCIKLAYNYYTGEGVEKNWRRAFDLYKRAYDMEYADRLLFGMARLVHVGGNKLPKDLQKARKLYTEGCNARSMECCTNLGFMYARGEGMKRDLKGALGYFERACAGGQRVGCANAGHYYHEGVVARRDRKRALSLFKKACAPNSPFDHARYACVRVAEYTERGRAGLKADPAAAFSVYQRHCTARRWEGCSALGSMTERGLAGLARNHRRAQTLHRRGCDHGDAEACARLGKSLEHTNSLSKALVAYERACAEQEMYADRASCAAAQRLRKRGVKRPETKRAVKRGAVDAAAVKP